MRLKPLDQCSGCLRVLVCLFMYGRRGTSSLKRHAQISQDAMNYALEVLQELGFVRLVPEEQFPFRKLVDLTDTGRDLVESPLTRWGQILW